MSLINDALKRATQAQPGSKSEPAIATPMEPVDSPRQVGLPSYFTPVLLFIISGACWFLVKGWETNRQAGHSSKPINVQARENANMEASRNAEPAPAPEASVESLIPPHRDFGLHDVADASEETSGPVVSSDEAKPVFKLQGIFYRPTNPSAVVNSKTVYVGDLISSGRIKAIDRQSVTIDLGSETKVLTLQ